MNIVTLSGRLVHEPVIKTTDSGTALLPLRLAVSRGDQDRTTDFINCQAWEKTAEFIVKYFHKGDPIEVCGRLQTKSYEKSDGTKVTETYVNIREVAFVLSKANNSADSNDDFEL